MYLRNLLNFINSPLLFPASLVHAVYILKVQSKGLSEISSPVLSIYLHMNMRTLNIYVDSIGLKSTIQCD